MGLKLYQPGLDLFGDGAYAFFIGAVITALENWLRICQAPRAVEPIAAVLGKEDCARGDGVDARGRCPADLRVDEGDRRDLAIREGRCLSNPVDAAVAGVVDVAIEHVVVAANPSVHAIAEEDIATGVTRGAEALVFPVGAAVTRVKYQEATAVLPATRDPTLILTDKGDGA